MGNSYTGLKGVGFFARDWKLQAWLFLLVRKIDPIEHPASWLIAARNHWNEQATLSINGCIDPGLERILEAEEQVQFVEKLVQEIYGDFTKMGDFVPKEFLNELCGCVPPSHYPNDVETEHFLKYGRAFLKLLAGEMKDTGTPDGTGCKSSTMQRLGKNHGGYHGETIDVHAVLRDIELVAQQLGWTLETFHADGEFKWIALHRLPSRNTQHATRIYISTGIHGDEPAGPLAVLRLLRENQWPANAELFLCPCLNPTGFALNKRENANGVDLNRDYLHLLSPEVRAHITWLEKQPAFDVSLCLHEDWESHGFYLYELNPDQKPSLAEAIVVGVAQVCPVDPSGIIEGREAKGGIIRPNLDPRSRPQWPEAIWLLTHKTRLSYTLEAPSDFPLGVRVNALVNGVNAALACLLLNLPASGSEQQI